MTKSHTFDRAAAILNTGRNTLTRRLRELGIIDRHNRPAGRYRGSAYFIVREGWYEHPTLGRQPYTRTEITPRGLRHIQQRLHQHKSKEHTPMPDHTDATLHNAGEVTVVTKDGERIHHRAAMVLVFDSPSDLQRAIDAHHCVYRARSDMPEAELHQHRAEH